MYPHFIEVHYLESEEPHLFNIDNIVCVHPGFDNKDTSVIESVSRELWVIEESYDKVKKLIMDSGCLIQMGDPRLDTTNPLTMKDLKRMIGEPVWNSNSRCWMLVGEDRGLAVNLTYNAGNGVDFLEEDLIKYPLYRMRHD